jgi:hypothetical protein
MKRIRRLCGMSENATKKKVRVTVDLPADLHDTFSTKCFLSRPRLRMNHVLERLVREWVGKPESSKSKR